jgi:NADH dehydrogenase
MTDHARPRVAIVGGGFGGLYLAKSLANRPVRVTLLDRSNHHVFQPLLYQVATAALSPGQIASPIRSILRRARNVEVMLAEVTGVDLAGRLLRVMGGPAVRYDYLAIATGARHSYFGRPEWEGRAPGLKSLEDALEIRRRILVAFERAERESDPATRRRELTFVIIGGGPTGVELAGAVAEIRRFAMTRDFRHIDPGDATVMLLEGGPRLLPMYPPNLSRRAAEALRSLGVEVRTGALVTGIEPGLVIAGDGRIATDTVIWAAGNQASPLIESLGCPRDRQGRALVEPDCSIPGHPEVFVIGDAAAYTHQPGVTLLPGVSQVAMQQGAHVARAILADCRVPAAAPRAPRRSFRYRDLGQLAVIGRGRAVAHLGRVRASGVVAWLLWIFVHIFWLIGFRNRVLVVVEWGWAYVTLQRGARLITGRWSPGGGEAPGDRPA